MIVVMEEVENAVVTMETERLVLKIVFQIEIDTNRDGDNFITREKYAIVSVTKVLLLRWGCLVSCMTSLPSRTLYIDDGESHDYQAGGCILCFRI